MIRLISSFFYFSILLSLTFNTNVNGQNNSSTPALQYKILPLDDLSHFQSSKSKDWIIAGNISADRNQEKNLEVKNGTGVLVYLPKQKESKTLQTKIVHSDIDLNLDFLLSKSASFRILLQGRYEVRIIDSWLKSGSNAMKAPGLWQNLSIRFTAPEFDSNGKKIKDALLEEVLINGVKVQSSSAILVSKAVFFTDEKNPRPLSILGEQSSFAIKNIRYKTFNKDKIKFTDVKFAVYQGLHKNIDTLKNLKPKRTGTTDTISHLVGDKKSQLVFDGFADIPADGEYLFKLTAGGGAWLFIDGALVIDNKGSRDFEKAYFDKKRLKKGRASFKIVYSNSDACLVLSYEGPQIPWHSLTTAASVRLAEQFEPLEYKIENKPVLQRGFMLTHRRVNPYIAAVGFPGNTNSPGLNYAYDMKNYNLSAVWHGKYIDVSNMWTERGEKQLEIPLGAKLELSAKPVLSKNLNNSMAWPDSVQAPEGVYSQRGYRLDQHNFPIFYYALDNTSVEDSFYPNQAKTGLTRCLKITNPVGALYCLLAEGSVIEKLGEGNFTVDDKKYYIADLETGALEATINHSADGDKLIVSIPTQKESITIKFDIIW